MDFTFIPDGTLDFHNKGVLLPYDVEKLLYEFIEEAEIIHKHKLLIITGKGQMVRPLVQKLLTEHPQVKSFQQASYYDGGNGAFQVII